MAAAQVREVDPGLGHHDGGVLRHDPHRVQPRAGRHLHQPRPEGLRGQGVHGQEQPGYLQVG